jgi:hypothetical protein
MIIQTFKRIHNRSYQILQIFQQPKKVSLGRWNIEWNIEMIHRKIDSSNEDHCGVCVVPQKNENEENDEYLKYYLL